MVAPVLFGYALAVTGLIKISLFNGPGLGLCFGYQALADQFYQALVQCLHAHRLTGLNG